VQQSFDWHFPEIIERQELAGFGSIRAIPKADFYTI
jgi:hypothetical protein